MNELKLKSDKMVASIEKPINKSSKNNKALMCTNNTNCNNKEIFEHSIDYNLFTTDSQNILSGTIFSVFDWCPAGHQ